MPVSGLLEAADLAAHLPDDSASKRALAGGWTLTEQLLALIADKLEVQIWQQTENGQKGRNRPKPIPRPGFEDQATGHMGGASMSLVQAERWLKSRRREAQPATR